MSACFHACASASAVVWALGISLVGFAGSSGCIQRAAPSVEIRHIETVLDGLHEAASQADGIRYFDLFLPRATFVGTDARERWSLEQFRRYAQPYFNKGQGWTYRPEQRQIELAEDQQTAWFYETLANAKYGRMRGSGVLVLRGGRWKIAQYVLSFAVPNSLARRVVRLIRDGPSRTKEGP